MLVRRREIQLDWRSVGVIIASVIFFDIFIWVFQSTNGVNKGFDNEAVRIMDNTFKVTTKAGAITTTLPAAVEAFKEETVIIETVLKKQDEMDNFLAFYDRYAQIKIYVDDELKAGKEEAAVPFKMSPGSYWHFIRLPKDYEGMSLRIERISYSQKYAGDIPEIYIGTKSAFLYMVMKRETLPLLTGTSSALFGIVVMVISILLKELLARRRMFRLGLLIVVISVWQLLETPITQLLMGNIYLADYVSYSCFFGLPILALSYLLTYPSIERSRLMRIAFPLAVVIYTAAQVLQVTGILMYIEMLPLGHAQFALIAIGLLACFLRYIKSGEKSRDETALYQASWALVVLVIIDLLRYYISPNGIMELYSKYGIAVFIVCMGYVGVNQIGELKIKEEHNKLLNQLAYQDGTTGLFNRYSFELKKEEIQLGEKSGDIVILIADMNNLKTINDCYGHAKGDEAIMQMAKLLKKYFGKENECYRLGGDEFCVISHWEDSRIDQAIEHLIKEAEEFAKEKNYPFSVACGYERTKPADIEECFKRADAKMYAIKKRMKCKVTNK